MTLIVAYLTLPAKLFARLAPKISVIAIDIQRTTSTMRSPSTVPLLVCACAAGRRIAIENDDRAEEPRPMSRSCGSRPSTVAPLIAYVVAITHEFGDAVRIDQLAVQVPGIAAAMKHDRRRRQTRCVEPARCPSTVDHRKVTVQYQPIVRKNRGRSRRADHNIGADPGAPGWKSAARTPRCQHQQVGPLSFIGRRDGGPAVA